MREVGNTLVIKNNLYFPVLFFFIGFGREVIEEIEVIEVSKMEYRW